ncbi:hypothetical protein CRUP_010299 [Coryphaenoides rupestris]|nr:hypothetical protein CRUP_010299 [Coryphaenoides rupestris]
MAAMEVNTVAGAVSREDRAGAAAAAPGSGMEAPGGGEDQADRAAGAGMKAPGGVERSGGAPGAGMEVPGGGEDQTDRAGGAPRAGMRAPGGGQDQADRAGGAAGVCRLKLFNKKNPKVMETIHKQFIVDLQRAIQEAYLRQKLKALQAENAALAQRVQSGREAIASTELRIATAMDKWKRGWATPGITVAWSTAITVAWSTAITVESVTPLR